MLIYNLFTPRYSWNTAKVCVKHHSINPLNFKEILNSDGQHFHKYQQNDKIGSHLNSMNIKKDQTMTCDIGNDMQFFFIVCLYLYCCWLIDWLMFNTTFSHISTILLHYSCWALFKFFNILGIFFTGLHFFR
jgi:hypothetical protein